MKDPNEGGPDLPSYAITSRDQIREALLDSALVHDRQPTDELVGTNSGMTSFNTLEGAEHTEHRMRVSRPLSRGRINGLSPTVRSVAEELLTNKIAGSLFDLGDGYARRLCTIGAARVLGFGRDEGRAVADLAQGVIMVENATRRKLNIFKIFRKLGTLVDATTALAPRDRDATLVASLLDAGADRQDVLGVGMALFISGELAARALLVCISASGQGTEVGDLSDEAIDSLIAEGEIITNIRRVATRDTRVGDLDLHTGQMISLVVHEVRGDQLGQPAVSWPFGLGRHYCLGAPWTRLVASVGAIAFWDTYPNAIIVERGVSSGGPGGLVSLVAKILAQSRGLSKPEVTAEGSNDPNTSRTGAYASQTSPHRLRDS